MGFFDDLTGLVGDVAKIAIAPVAIAASVTRVVTKPVSEFAQEVVEEIRDLSE